MNRPQLGLRGRLALVVASAFALAVVAAAIAALGLTRNEIRSETDRLLVERAELIGPSLDLADLERRFPSRSGRSAGAAALRDLVFTRDDITTQVLAPTGDTFELSNEPLPVDDVDMAVANRGEGAVLRYVDIDGDRHRLVTQPLRRGVAVQLARSLAVDDRIIGGLVRRFTVVGVLGVLLSGLAGWLIARRTIGPVEELTAAAEHVAATEDLDSRIEVERTDEVARLANAFNSMLDSLASSRSQQQSLVMDASHELRTPLTSLRTNVGLIDRLDRFDPEERRAILDDVGAELEELTDLVTELVDLAAFHERPGEPASSVDLVALVERVVDRARRRTDREVMLTAAPGTPEIQGHTVMLERAIGNLLGNAAKFSPTDTAIEVLVTPGSVQVLDRGPGVDDADKARIFDRFYRSDATRSFPGSGLGLAIVASVATAHAGSVEVTDRDGGGSVFSLQLP